MLYWVFTPLSDLWIGFNVFRYITFRTGLAIATAFLLSLVLGPALIKKLAAAGVRQSIRPEGPAGHLPKQGTPTMGGVLIIGSVVASTLLWSNLGNSYVWMVLGSTLGFAAIGFVDDLIKVKQQRSLGLTTRQKLLLQTVLAVVAAVVAREVAAPAEHAGALALPFFKDLLIPLGIGYFPFVVVVLLGSANAVNLTDGLDGLASGAVAIAAATYTILVYVAGHARIAEYLRLVGVTGAGEVTVFTGAMVGAALGFLWFNCHPAQVFMGDVGSLALGGGIGIVAIIVKQELLLVLVGGLFVLEALSVVVQVGSYRFFNGRRVFLMAPLHHHFEKLGWKESQIVVRFWIVSVVFALAGLATLKLR